METFEGPFFFVSAGLLVVVALGIAAAGMFSEKFPGEGRLGAVLTGITALLVVTTALGAVAEARHEQEIRRAEVAEFERERANEEQDAAEGEGEVGAEEGGEDEGDEEPFAPDEATPGGEGETAGVDGAEIFESQGCGSCHALQAANSAGQIGPSLDESLVDKNEAFIRTSIIDPSAQIAEGFGDQMPGDYEQELSEVELDALVQFLAESTSGN